MAGTGFGCEGGRIAFSYNLTSNYGSDPLQTDQYQVLTPIVMEPYAKKNLQGDVVAVVKFSCPKSVLRPFVRNTS